MKKWLFILIALCIGAAILAVVHFSERGDISHVEIDYGNSQLYTERELYMAAETLTKAFQTEFPEYVLNKIWYVNDLRQLEDAADMVAAVPYDGRIIIFYSDMERKAEATVEPEKLLRYKWCIEANDAGNWHVLAHGF